jgi:hypothetical protein
MPMPPRPLRLTITIVLAPIWLPFYLMVMGLGIMLGQPMIWPSILMHLKYRTPHDPPLQLRSHPVDLAPKERTPRS